MRRPAVRVFRLEATVRSPPSLEQSVAAAASACVDSIEAALQFAGSHAHRFPLPAGGKTALRWSLLRAVGAADLTVGRVLEPHLDALAILAEADMAPAPGLWGVYAAEAAGIELRAIRDGANWRLAGTKPWCSLAGHLDRALVTARATDGVRLFAVNLKDKGVTIQPSRWIARGLRAVDSGPVNFAHTPAEAVGPPGWYLTRPGFAWGGIGVAACWLGGASALVRRLRDVLGGRERNELRLYNLGTADVALHSAGCVLDASAVMIDAGDAIGLEGSVLMARVRAVVAGAVETILEHVGHALGPGPLAFDEEYARRVADLQLYVRQHHAERDLAELGGQLLDATSS
jgi:alkylation response protein AidB-like acyl-CoA dehydrogenase